MLVALHMQNIALIDDVSLEFAPGLNILTGETGAGKSILLDGINLALGGRVQRDLLRDAGAASQVDLLFEDPSGRADAMLEESGIHPESGEILLTRIFTSAGRSVCRINGQIVTAAQMKEISRLLIDIHGQHEHQSLLDVNRHREILDRFDDAIGLSLKQYQTLYREYRRIAEELESYLKDARDKERMLSLMEYEKQEIEQAALQEGEEERLKAERRRLYNAERMQEAVGNAYSMLADGESGPASADLLQQAIGQLTSILSMDPDRLEPMSDSLQEAGAILDEISYQLRDYLESLEMDPNRLSEVEERLDLIRRIQAKYGQTPEQVQSYYQDLLVRMDRLENVQRTQHELEKKQNDCEKKLRAEADRLHALRQKAAAEIERDVTVILGTLQFSDPLFVVHLQETDDYKTYGTDEIEFRIRTNVGDAIKPLHMIASGGEMSRIMLAIKTVLAKRDEIPTLIFDEIDTGISGRTAQSVAEKMAQIAGFHQVLCVTHLPQIAAMADAHYRIEKQVEAGRTHTLVTHLDQESMIEELARISGGASITQKVYDSVREMKEQAEERKRVLRSEDTP